MTASVVAAFFASGGLNAGTPVAIASVPVRATAPAANARRSRRTETAWTRLADLARRGPRVYARALAEDDDPERADRDHQQRRAEEQVGRDGEDVAGLAQAAEVADRDQGDRDDADDARARR